MTKMPVVVQQVVPELVREEQVELLVGVEVQHTIPDQVQCGFHKASNSKFLRIFELLGIQPSYSFDQLRRQWLYSKLRQFSFRGHKNSNNRPTTDLVRPYHIFYK
jgi:hypothetical protein